MRVRRRTVARLWRGSLALLAMALAASSVATAHAAWRALSEHGARIVVQPVPPPATSYEAENHFAGEALLDTGGATPAASTQARATGTTELPPFPVPAAAAQALAAAEPGVVAAQPFSLTRASALDRARALQCLADAIYYEAASEPDDGQRAVAQVVLNRVRHPAFPATVCGVVYQGSERGGCQFSFACDGATARIPSRSGWARAARVAAAALAGYVYAPVGLATHYHTYAVTPAWNRALVMTDAAGAHFFHRWKGWWGTSAAFRQHYAGGEPLPGPHAPVTPLPPVTMASMPAPLPPTPATNVRPAYAAAGVPIAPAPVGDHLPPASTILPRWQDSGKPL